MNRKHNPWISLVALLLLVTLLVTVCTGCDAVQAEEEHDRFTVEWVGGNNIASTYILTDKETGAQYLYVSGGYGGDLTVLQPAPAEEG